MFSAVSTLLASLGVSRQDYHHALNAKAPRGPSQEFHLVLGDDIEGRRLESSRFLNKYNPTKFCNSFDPPSTLTFRTSWPHDPAGVIIEYEPGVHEDLKSSFKRACAERKDVDEPLVIDLCLEHHILGGRFIIYASASSVDSYWEKIIALISTCDYALTAKLSYQLLKARSPKPVFIINIYIQDLTDFDGRAWLLKGLKEAGIKKTIPLKPLAYDILGITSDNQWNIQSSTTLDRDAIVSLHSYSPTPTHKPNLEQEERPYSEFEVNIEVVEVEFVDLDGMLGPEEEAASDSV